MQVHDAGERTHHSLEMAALDDGARDPSSRPDLSVPEHAGCSDAGALRTDIRASASPRSFLVLTVFSKQFKASRLGKRRRWADRARCAIPREHPRLPGWN